MVVVKSLSHAVKVSNGCKDDENVEDLMRVSPDVKGTRCASLGPTNLFSQLVIVSKEIGDERTA